jgi:hypothetical protein
VVYPSPMLPPSRSLRPRVLAALAAATAPLVLVVAACGGGDDDGGLLDDGTDASTGAPGATPASDATVEDSGSDARSDASSLDASDATTDAGDAGLDAANDFDGGPYLVFYGQMLGDGGTEGTVGFHLYDEGTLAPAGDFLVDPDATEVLDVTRDPLAATWWTMARLTGGVQAAAGYAVRTGLLSSGPLAFADGGSSSAPAAAYVFAAGASGTTYFGTAGALSSVSSAGAVTPITLPDPTITVTYLAYDGTVGLLAATAPIALDGGASEPYVLVLAPGQSTVTTAPSTWEPFVGDGGADGGDDAGDAGDAGDTGADAGDAGDAGDGGDVGDAGDDGGGASGDGGTAAGATGITALTVAPGGHLVYGILTSGLAIVDLTASTGTVVPTPANMVPSVGAIPVITADGAHVVFAADTTSFTRVLLVFDTASGTFTPITDTDGYAFSTDLVIAGDGARIYGVELANNPGAASQLVRVDPVARSLAQTASLSLDERASLIPRFFSAQ